ncbi:hypothetical protein TNCV_3365011 [Trichonephila clavipes]|nr:hypothetical protein TNCV_3365011 [Trichonephila clavipes]
MWGRSFLRSSKISSTKDSPCRRGRYTLNMSELKRPLVGVVVRRRWYQLSCRSRHSTEECVNINVALFSYPGAFDDGLRNFKPWSSAVDET